MKDARIWCIILNSSNFIVGAMDIYKPITDEQEMVSTIYVLISIILAFLLALSYKERYLILIPYILLVLIIRN